MNYLSILHAFALLLTLPIGIKHLADTIIAVIVEAPALCQRNTYISTEDVALITGTALLTMSLATLRRGQTVAGGRTGSCTNFIVAVDWTFHCCRQGT